MGFPLEQSKGKQGGIGGGADDGSSGTYTTSMAALEVSKQDKKEDSESGRALMLPPAFSFCH